MSIQYKIGEHQKEEILEQKNNEINFNEEMEEQQIEVHNNQELIKILDLYSKPLNNLSKGIWVFIIVFIISIFFR